MQSAKGDGDGSGGGGGGGIKSWSTPPDTKGSHETDRGPRRASIRTGGTSVGLERDALLENFSSKSVALADELGRENERLREEIAALEDENTALRTQVASDSAIRDLLKSIEEMEQDKRQLLAHMGESRGSGSRAGARFADLERELEHFVNLYVATHQLHGSLRPTTVIRQLREIMVQLIGARTVGIFIADEAGTTLLPVTAEGVALSDLTPIDLTGHESPSETSRIAKAFRTRTPEIIEGDMRGASLALPAACIPMNLDERTVGVIVIFELLGHKKRLSGVDFELIKLVAKNAAPALLAAHLFVLNEGRLPNLSALREVLM